MRELVLAKEVICIHGSHTFDLDDTLKVVAYLVSFGCSKPLLQSKGYHQLFVLPHAVDRFSPRRSRPVARSLTSNLSELPFVQRRYGCCDARDRVFALLSLLTPEDRRALKSILCSGYRMSVMEAWCTTTKTAVFVSGTLNDLGNECDCASDDPYHTIFLRGCRLWSTKGSILRYRTNDLTHLLIRGLAQKRKQAASRCPRLYVSS